LAASGIWLNQVSHALFAALGQRIETLALFGGQSIGQATMCSSACMMTKGSAEPLLALKSVPLTGPFLDEVCVDRCWKNIDLFCDKCQQSRWWPLINAHGATGMSQVAAHEGIAEAVVITAAVVDRCQIGFRQSVRADQFANSSAICASFTPRLPLTRSSNR
jgi:hypothetical protein